MKWAAFTLDECGIWTSNKLEGIVSRDITPFLKFAKRCWRNFNTDHNDLLCSMSVVEQFLGQLPQGLLDSESVPPETDVQHA